MPVVYHDGLCRVSAVPRRDAVNGIARQHGHGDVTAAVQDWVDSAGRILPAAPMWGHVLRCDPAGDDLSIAVRTGNLHPPMSLRIHGGRTGGLYKGAAAERAELCCACVGTSADVETFMGQDDELLRLRRSRRLRLDGTLRLRRGRRSGTEDSMLRCRLPI